MSSRAVSISELCRLYTIPGELLAFTRQMASRCNVTKLHLAQAALWSSAFRQSAPLFLPTTEVGTVQTDPWSRPLRRRRRGNSIPRNHQFPPVPDRHTHLDEGQSTDCSATSGDAPLKLKRFEIADGLFVVNAARRVLRTAIRQPLSSGLDYEQRQSQHYRRGTLRSPIFRF